MESQSLVDDREFRQLIDPYHHELLVHCYRMLGSLSEAEDVLQETLLRAWQHLDSLKTQSSLRAWMYRIASNAALDALDRRKRRALPDNLFDTADPDSPLPGALEDSVWLGPLPDTFLDGLPANPEAHYELQESVRLAFLAALQQLPGRQRAVLILRDVLEWRAEEAAEALGLSVAAANSALQRARATLKRYRDDSSASAAASNSQNTDELLSRYLRAWETADAASLVALLREDAALTMPPLPMWLLGCDAIRAFLDRLLFAGQAEGRFRLLPTHANGSPALGVYQRGDDGLYAPVGLQVLELRGGQISRIDDFLVQDGSLFVQFGLPLSL